MRFRISCLLLVYTWPLAAAAGESPETLKSVPSGVILVKGAWASASDSVTPVPEGGSVDGRVFTNEYFGITFPLPADWMQKFQGPPPSDSGRYVLAQLRPADDSRGGSRGNILITAQDMFFTPTPAANSLELIAYEQHNLPNTYRLERPPTALRVAGRPFTFLAYGSAAAELHWYVLATEIRCHALEFVLSSRNTRLLTSVMREMNTMKLPAEADPGGGNGGGGVPICIKDYAKDANVLARVDPILTEHRFNAVPVRIIIDKSGKVRHIHFLSAFPDQQSVIADALRRWQFKPYLQDGQRVEVETGIMFGRNPSAVAPAGGSRDSTQ